MEAKTSKEIAPQKRTLGGHNILVECINDMRSVIILACGADTTDTQTYGTVNLGLESDVWREALDWFILS